MCLNVFSSYLSGEKDYNTINVLKKLKICTPSDVLIWCLINLDIGNVLVLYVLAVMQLQRL